jgi:thioredoxin 1
MVYLYLEDGAGRQKGRAMGFLKRLIGLETKPGEPETLNEERFEGEVLRSELPCVVEFYNLWCASCQVMTGLLNEIGPGYLGRAKFYKVNVDRTPSIPLRFQISGVPTIVLFDGGEPKDRLTGLVPLNDLRAWIDERISAGPQGPID